MTRGGDILLIDDDAEYALLMQIALQEVGVENRLVVVSDGAEAIAYLRKEGAFCDRNSELPLLVLLDLRMPRMTGLEFLRWKNRQLEFRNLRVGVLTGTEIGDDRRQAMELGAQFFSVKPFAFNELLQVVAQIRDRFLAAEKHMAEAA